MILFALTNGEFSNRGEPGPFEGQGGFLIFGGSPLELTDDGIAGTEYLWPVPVFDVSSFELTMVASQIASADLANFHSYFFPVIASSTQEISPQIQGSQPFEDEMSQVWDRTFQFV